MRLSNDCFRAVPETPWGMPKIPMTQTMRTAMMTMSLALMFVFMESLLCFVLGYGGNGALDHFDAEVVRGNAELDGVVFDGSNDAANAAGGGDSIPGF